MGQGRQTVSVVILAKNEADRIGTCLERLRWADEIVVVDDMSTDRTAEICRYFGARVVQRPLDTFSNQANFGLQHATGDWILTLDADELVSPLLRQEIEDVLLRDAGHVGFTFKRLNHFLGHEMRHGGWYHDLLRLFRRDAGTFTGKVHLTPQLEGPVGRLRGHVEHYPFQSLSQFVDRQNRYTSVEAEELLERHGTALMKAVRGQILVKPAKLAWKFYVKKQGFRDGRHGLVFSMLFAWVHFLKWAKYWELLYTGSSASRAPSPPGISSEGCR